MTEDRDGDELPYIVTHEDAEEFISALRSVREALERIERDAQNQKKATERRDISRATDPMLAGLPAGGES